MWNRGRAACSLAPIPCVKTASACSAVFEGLCVTASACALRTALHSRGATEARRGSARAMRSARVEVQLSSCSVLLGVARCCSVLHEASIGFWNCAREQQFHKQSRVPPPVVSRCHRDRLRGSASPCEGFSVRIRPTAPSGLPLPSPINPVYSSPIKPVHTAAAIDSAAPRLRVRGFPFAVH